VQIRSCVLLQVSTYLDTLDVYYTDLNEGNRAYVGQFCAIFDPSRQGGRNRKNRDCALTRRAIISPSRALILVYIGKEITSLPCSRVPIFHLGRCGRDSTHFLLLLLVRLILLLDTLLTCFTCYLESTEPLTVPRALLGVAL